MASVSAHVPVAVILLVGGLLSCFLGYRLLRLLVAVYGFGLGVIIVTAFADRLEPWVMVAVMAGGGLLGALLAKAAYLAVVAVLGAGLGAVVVRAGGLSGAGEPGLWVMLSVCLAGALAALALRKYVVIVGTSFGGAWTALVGGLALAGDNAAVAAASGDGAAGVSAGAREHADGVRGGLVRARRRRVARPAPHRPPASVDLNAAFDRVAPHSVTSAVGVAADPGPRRRSSSVAQLAEHSAVNRRVVGSSPT